jgi:hypothetical protein
LPLALLAAIVPARPGERLSPEELIRAEMENNSPQDETFGMRLRLVDAEGKEKLRTSVTFFKRKDPGEQEQMRLIRFLTPAEMKRAAVLIVENRDAENDQWIYIPAMFTTRRVPPANRADKYMGTDFCYQDVSIIPIAKHSFKDMGEETYEGQPCRLIERTPTDPKLKAESAYSRALQWIDPHAVVLKEEFYDASGKLSRRYFARGVRRMGKYWRPSEVEMDDLASGHRTIIEYIDRRIDKGLSAKLFTTRAMEMER